MIEDENVKKYTRDNMKVEKAIEFLVKNAKMK